jgi:hypothetical protein
MSKKDQPKISDKWASDSKAVSVKKSVRNRLKTQLSK